jgi:hypothetical protein
VLLRSKAGKADPWLTALRDRKPRLVVAVALAQDGARRLGDHESAALVLYKELLGAVEGRSVMLEEYARQMIHAEELHAGEVDKMLRKPGEVSTTGLGPSSL